MSGSQHVGKQINTKRYNPQAFFRWALAMYRMLRRYCIIASTVTARGGGGSAPAHPTYMDLCLFCTGVDNYLEFEALDQSFTLYRGKRKNG